MATRTAARPSSRPRSGGGRVSYSRRPASARRGGTVSSRPRRTPARRRRRRRGPGLPIRLGRAMFRLVAGLWLLLARLAGTAARAVGSGAADLAPTHRRDGFGLAAIAAAVVSAAALWAHGAGPVGLVVIAVVRGAVGATALVVPLVCLVGAW